MRHAKTVAGVEQAGAQVNRARGLRGMLNVVRGQQDDCWPLRLNPRYIADILCEFRNSKIAKEGWVSRLLFKKRMFRETDETITEPQFINLTYVQVRSHSSTDQLSSSGACRSTPVPLSVHPLRLWRPYKLCTARCPHVFTDRV